MAETAKSIKMLCKAFDDGDYSDNHTLRDPHYVEDNGHKYLVFEANTGTEVGYQGEAISISIKLYYGGSDDILPR